jgi:dTDP-4-dehydrorhamnose reductase
MSEDELKNSAGHALRIGVLGAAGQLGRCLVRAIEATDDLEVAFAATREQIDLTDFERIGEWLDSQDAPSPEVVINAAAYTKVDACESEKELAYRMNAMAPGEWARQSMERSIHFIHVSTDYVFPGDGSRPYREDDETEPKTVYGSSKRAGEVAVLGTDPTALVVRTSWVFGPGRNFVVAILDQAARRRTGELEGPLKVVDDQRGAPTYAADLAEALLAVSRLDRSSRNPVCGLLHLRNAGETTWFGFARAILDHGGYADLEIEPVATSAFKTAAARPAYSVLSCERGEALGITLRPWREALVDYLSSPDAPRELLSDVHPSDTGPDEGESAESRRSEVSR